MTYFPVTNSNLSATHIGMFLQEKYSLSKDTKCQLIKAGINDTYLVTDNSEKFVFRVYSLNWRSKTEIDEEIKLLNQLKENAIPISYAQMCIRDSSLILFTSKTGSYMPKNLSVARSRS